MMYNGYLANSFQFTNVERDFETFHVWKERVSPDYQVMSENQFSGHNYVEKEPNSNKKTFNCPQCRYTTDRKNNLKRHIMTMHYDCDRNLECCNIKFRSKAALRDHVILFHKNGYRCSTCSRNFCRKALLRRHLSVHSGQKDFHCGQCEYATSHKSNLERHQKVHSKTFGSSWKSFDISPCKEESTADSDMHSKTFGVSWKSYDIQPCKGAMSPDRNGLSKTYGPSWKSYDIQPCKGAMSPDSNVLSKTYGASWKSYDIPQSQKVVNPGSNVHNYQNNDIATEKHGSSKEILRSKSQPLTEALENSQEKTMVGVGLCNGIEVLNCPISLPSKWSDFADINSKNVRSVVNDTSNAVRINLNKNMDDVKLEASSGIDTENFCKNVSKMQGKSKPSRLFLTPYRCAKCKKQFSKQTKAFEHLCPNEVPEGLYSIVCTVRKQQSRCS